MTSFDYFTCKPKYPHTNSLLLQNLWDPQLSFSKSWLQISRAIPTHLDPSMATSQNTLRYRRETDHRHSDGVSRNIIIFYFWKGRVDT